MESNLPAVGGVFDNETWPRDLLKRTGRMDKMRVVVERINPNCYLRLVKRLTIQSGFRDTRFLRSR